MPGTFLPSGDVYSSLSVHPATKFSKAQGIRQFFQKHRAFVN
jgi:hypothetical protein